MRRISNIEYIKLVANCRKVRVMIPNPFFRELFVLGHGVADNVDVAADIARRDDYGGGNAAATSRSMHNICSGTFGNECTVGKDLCAIACNGPGDAAPG